MTHPVPGAPAGPALPRALARHCPALWPGTAQRASLASAPPGTAG